MFKTLKMTNFRQHEDKVVQFEPGLNVMRGANEAGKSTCLLAIGYALFGTKALSQPIDEVVTWGKDARSLRVELDFEFQGMPYSLVRSKAGAELRFGKETVTGQTEVTRYIESLFKANADLANKMMFSNQGSIRGALEEGPKAAMQIIEDLADFDLIERIIEAIQAKLPSGNTTRVEERLAQFANGMGEEPKAPDTTELDQALANTVAQIAALNEKKREALANIEQLQKDYAEGSREIGNPYVKALEQLDRLKDRIAANQRELERLQSNPAPTYDAELHQKAVHAVQEENFASDKIKIYRQMSTLPKVDDEFWEGDLVSLDTFRDEQNKLKAAAQTLIAELRGEIKVQEAMKIKETACGLCGKDLSEVPEVLEKNRLAQEKIEKAQADLVKAENDFKEACSNLETVASINKSVAGIHPFLERHESLLNLNKATVPWGFSWKGEIPKQPDGSWKQTLTQCEQAKTQLDMYSGKLEGLKDSLANDQKELAERQEKFDEFKPTYDAWMKDVVGPLQVANTFEQECKAVFANLELDKQKVESQIKQARMQYESSLANWNSTKDNVESAKKELEQMNFNNALIKKIRTARPQIADKLWAIVLTTVSHYFSEIRGTRSTVTRSANGFQVDGRTISGLSGSTLDALGLAIRMALTKTFLPLVSFTLLDEPAAACDDARESSMLGTVSASEFDQIILVTHSDLADSFAQNLIQL